VSGSGPIVLTSPNGDVAAINFRDARKAVGNGGRNVFWLRGGTAAWKEAGNPVDAECKWLSDPVDVYKRPYEGTDNAAKNMQAYIDWEHGLVAQLANDGIAGFHVVRDIKSS
jgi:hypothetical protein